MGVALGGLDFEWTRPLGRVALVEAPSIVDSRPHDPDEGPYLAAFESFEFESIGYVPDKADPLSAHALWTAWLENASHDPSIDSMKGRAPSIIQRMGFPFRAPHGTVDLGRGAHPFHWVQADQGLGLGVAWRDVRLRLEEIATFERTRLTLANARGAIGDRVLEDMVFEGAADELFVVLPGDEADGASASKRRWLARAERKIVAQGALALWRDQKGGLRRADKARQLVSAWMAIHLNYQLARTTAAGVPTAVGAPHSPVSAWPLDLFGAMWLVASQHFIGEQHGFECANPTCRKWVTGKKSHARFCDSSVCRRKMSPKEITRRAAPVANR